MLFEEWMNLLNDLPINAQDRSLGHSLVHLLALREDGVEEKVQIALLGQMRLLRAVPQDFVALTDFFRPHQFPRTVEFLLRWLALNKQGSLLQN
jgi:hypothetical protein